MVDSAAKAVWCFGEFELDPLAGELYQNGQLIRLQPQQLQLLVVLVEAAGHVVERKNLHKALWPEQSFGEFEDGLNHAVIRLRAALGDSAQSPSFIETVPRRGYRFIAPVETQPSRPASPAREPPKTKLTRTAVIVFCCIALFALAAAVWHSRFRLRAHKAQSVAILPLSNLTGDSKKEFFADGVTEDLTTELARIDPERVVSRTTTMRYKGSAKSLTEIGRELSADAVVEGAVQRSGDRVRLTLQLIEARNDRHLWAESYEGTASEVLRIEARATLDLAHQIGLTLSEKDEQRLERSRTVDPQAYEAYLNGRRETRISTPAHLLEAVKYFEIAIQKDPGYALAYAQLAHTYGMLNFSQGIAPDDSSSKFRSLTQKALELDDQLAEAHVNLGDIRFYGDWDWSSGEAEFRHAVELDRSSVDVQEHYALALWLLGRYDAAFQEMQRAERLDPMSPRVNVELGSILRDQGATDQSIPFFRKALELQPGYATAFDDLGGAYEELGREQEAIAAYLRAASLNGEEPANVKMLSDRFESGGMHAYWTARLEQLQTRAEHRTVSPLAFASVCVHLGKYDEAIDWLERAYRQHLPSLAWINAGRTWSLLRSHTRFQALLQRMHFPKAPADN